MQPVTKVIIESTHYVPARIFRNKRDLLKLLIDLTEERAEYKVEVFDSFEEAIK